MSDPIPVEEKEQIMANLERLSSCLRRKTKCQACQGRKEKERDCKMLIRQGRNFVYYHSPKYGHMFAPSRFVGYQDSKPSGYFFLTENNRWATKETTRDGGESDSAIRYLLGDWVSGRNASKHKKTLDAFCKKMGIEDLNKCPGGRKYWDFSQENPNQSERDNPSAILRDLREVKKKFRKKTEQERRIQARLGQGQFRADLLKIWGGRCALTNCDVVPILRASHIKPWKKSNDRERLDPNNGLLLVPDVDALFDKGLISFDKDGKLIKSAELAKKSLDSLALSTRQKICLPQKEKLNGKQKKYLAFHRKHILRKK